MPSVSSPARGTVRCDGSRRELFIVPAEGSAASGGNLYNDGLLAALTASRDAPASFRCEPELLSTLGLADFDPVWVDSLYFDKLAWIRAQLPAGVRLRLLAHALPSSLAEAAGAPSVALLAQECALLAGLDGALAPSSSMAQLLRARAEELPVWVVQPAVRRAADLRIAPAAQPRAVLVANLVPNKGVLPWLSELGRELLPTDAFTLRCIGRLDADRAYAQACQELLAGLAPLSARVQLVGALTPRQVLEELGRAHLFVSASRGESFGMALADARASGCVVLARAGGHVPQLVDPAAGGQLFDDDAALARSFLALCRDPSELTQRLMLARARPLPERSWGDVAREFCERTRS